MRAYDRFKYIIERGGVYFQAFNIYEADREKKTARWSGYKSDAKKFDSLMDAQETVKQIGGGVRILRYDMLTTECVDVWEEMRSGAERRWVAMGAED